MPHKFRKPDTRKREGAFQKFQSVFRPGFEHNGNGYISHINFREEELIITFPRDKWHPPEVIDRSFDDLEYTWTDRYGGLYWLDEEP